MRSSVPTDKGQSARGWGKTGDKSALRAQRRSNAGFGRVGPGHNSEFHVKHRRGPTTARPGAGRRGGVRVAVLSEAGPPVGRAARASAAPTEPPPSDTSAAPLPAACGRCSTWNPAAPELRRPPKRSGSRGRRPARGRWTSSTGPPNPGPPPPPGSNRVARREGSRPRGRHGAPTTG